MDNYYRVQATLASYHRARQRAFCRMAREFPECYETYIREELAKEPDYKPTRKGSLDVSERV